MTHLRRFCRVLTRCVLASSAVAAGCSATGDAEPASHDGAADVVVAPDLSPPDTGAPSGPGQEAGPIGPEDPLVAAPLAIYTEVNNPSPELFAFTDVTDVAGIGETITAMGVAFVDYDDDGWPDVTATTHQGLQLFRNVGGRFVEATEQAIRDGAGPGGNLGWTTGVTYADIDGDGDLDLAVGIQSGEARLLMNDGAGHLVVQPLGGLPPRTAANQLSFADVNGDGALDLYIANGMDLTAATPPAGPYGERGTPNVFLLQEGGRFVDRTAAWGAEAGATSESFLALFADFDRDSDPDALVIRDYRPEHFLRNDGDRFVDDSEAAIGHEPTSAMGLAIGDLNGDGHLDVYATDIDDDILFQGRGDGTFRNVFQEVLDSPDPTAIFKSWGCALLDADLDGDQDVITLSGFGDPPEMRPGGWVFFQNGGHGNLRDKTAGLGLPPGINGAGLAVADYDLDGDLDVIAAITEPPGGTSAGGLTQGMMLLRNDSGAANGRHALSLELRQPLPNGRAVGAIVEVRTPIFRTSRVVTAGESYRSSHTTVLNFGLGTRTEATVHVWWPGGVAQTAFGVPAGYRRLARSPGDCCYPGGTCPGALAACEVW